MSDALLTQVVIAYLATHLLELAKRSSAIPWITRTTDTLNKLVGAALAALTVVGIAVATNWDSPTGTFTLTVSGLSMQSVLTFLWNWLEQFVLQQGWYKGVVKPNAKE